MTISNKKNIYTSSRNKILTRVCLFTQNQNIYMPQTKYFMTKGPPSMVSDFPETKEDKFLIFFSLFKGRDTQSQFLETFYDLMEILYN